MDAFDVCIHKISYVKYLNESFGGNRAALNALKAVLPEVIENELTPRQRDCIKMSYFEGLTQQQIAKRLGLSQPSVSKCIKAAKARLNTILKYSLAAGCKASAMEN